MKSYKVHYMNKYPAGRVQSSEAAVDVFSAEGKHVVALRKNGAGQWVDASEEEQCAGRHDLSPLPKNARFMKLFWDGKIGQAEEYEERHPVAAKLAKKFGKVPSIEELKKAGEKVGEKGDWIAPAPAPAADAQ